MTIPERRQENGSDICQVCDERQAVIITSPAAGQTTTEETPESVAMCPECMVTIFLPTNLDYCGVDHVLNVVKRWAIEDAMKKMEN